MVSAVLGVMAFAQLPLPGFVQIIADYRGATLRGSPQ